MIASTNGALVLNGHQLNGSKTSVVTDFVTGHFSPRLPQILHIRPCRKTDRAAIRHLCCETGFLGRPVDPLFQDRELFADLFTRPYLDYEPDWGFVAEADGRVVGYLLGSVRANFDSLQVWSGLRTASKMILRLASGRYADHPRSRKFIRWLFTAGFREQPKHPRGAAHLHFDIDRNFRGGGVGKKLWDVFEARLRSAGVKQCYGAFFSHPQRRPESVYRRYGFSVFDRRPTSLFKPEIAEPVEVVCVCKKL